MSEEPTTIVHHHHETSTPPHHNPPQSDQFPPPSQLFHHQHDRAHPTHPNFTMSEEPTTIVHHRHETRTPPHHNPPQSDQFPPPAQIFHHQHDRGHPTHDDPNPFPSANPQYGTFTGVPAMGFPQPVPPRGSLNPPQYYAHGYQAVPGYAVAEGTPVRDREHEHRLPCCGIGYGWFLFILGFFVVGIPWYIGAFFLIFCKRTVDHREKPGYVACTIATVLAIIAILFGAVQVNYD